MEHAGEKNTGQWEPRSQSFPLMSTVLRVRVKNKTPQAFQYNKVTGLLILQDTFQMSHQHPQAQTAKAVSLRWSLNMGSCEAPRAGKAHELVGQFFSNQGTTIYMVARAIQQSQYPIFQTCRPQSKLVQNLAHLSSN